MKIPLKHGRRGGGTVVAYAEVSDHRYVELMKWEWRFYQNQNGDCYAVRTENFWKDGHRESVLVYMHLQILGIPPGSGHSWEVHHKDGNGLNNQDFNLDKLDHHSHEKSKDKWRGRKKLK
jgi:hypothetical protein